MSPCLCVCLHHRHSVPALGALFFGFLAYEVIFFFLTAGALKRTMVGGIPPENIWDAAIALECLEPGFEVGHPGGLLDSISQAGLSCIV